jgi:hypothetical protein
LPPALHRECELILDDWARSEHARSYAELGPEQQAAQPGEATSARMALRAAIAFNHVHPLSGGLEGRRQAGFAVEPLERVSSFNDKPTPRS